MFPELRAGMNSGKHGLLHLEMQVFLIFMQRAIALRNVKDVALCFQLAEKYFREGNEQMKIECNRRFVCRTPEPVRCAVGVGAVGPKLEEGISAMCQGRYDNIVAISVRRASWRSKPARSSTLSTRHRAPRPPSEPPIR